MSSMVKHKIHKRSSFVMIRLRPAERLEVERVAQTTGLNASELFRRSFKIASTRIEEAMKPLIGEGGAQ